jgi:hypothetical protein
MKYFLIILIFIALILGLELKRPLKEDTESVNRIVSLKNGLKVDFITNYDYQYYISLKLENANYSKLYPINYKITVNGKSEIIEDTFSLGNSSSNVGYFSSKSGDNCAFEILDIQNEIETKKANLIIDENGGGPSVGIAWAKEFRPLIKNLFIITLLLVFSLMILVLVKTFNSKKIK